MTAASLKIRLNDGWDIPVLGMGSGVGRDANALSTAKDWILSALKNGVRHIDTARYYGTEKAVGDAIRESGIRREEIWVTTKLPPCDHSRIRESFEESLRALGLEYIDMYLIHWPASFEYDPPNPFPKNPDGSFKFDEKLTVDVVWKGMEKLIDTGRVRTIGVSNFSIKLLEEILPTAKIVPAVNQVEMHPYLAQNPLRHYCARKGITITAFTPSGRQTVRDDPLIVSLAEKYKITPTQVIIAWHVSRGQVLLPTSHNAERQKENLDVKQLSEEDLAKIWDLERGERICNPPDASGKVLGWTLEQLGWETYHPKVVS